MIALDAEELFPTHGPLDEERQIGRTDTIVALADRLRERDDALLLEPRRVGKTSVVRAALTRARLQERAVTAHVDLTAANVGDGDSLASALLRALHDESGLLAPVLRTREALSRGREGISRLRDIGRKAQNAGVGELDPVVDALELLDLAVPSLDAVLEKLVQVARNRPVAVFLDEVQELRHWKDARTVQEALARFMRMDGRRVSMVVAGSDQTATAALFEQGSPLHWDFEPFPLPAIDAVEWHAGLAERFATAGCEISSLCIRQILDASGGHPLRTMRVAKGTLRAARAASDANVTWGAVDAAVADARTHPSWEDR